MTTVANFVAREIPLELRQSRDFTGDRGWVWIVNRFLKVLAREGLWRKTIQKEMPVEVTDNFWITIPSGLRRVVEIYHPPITTWTERKITYGHDIVNGKIKLEKPFGKDDDPDSFTLSEGGTSSVKIDDDDATADLWNDYALVLTNGTYSGDAILISDTAAADGGTSLLTFRHTRATISDSTAGYLTQKYLMLLYEAAYAAVSAHTDELPIDDEFEDLLAFYIMWQAFPLNDKRRAVAKTDFNVALELAKDEHFTPTLDQAHVDGRSMPGFEDCSAYDNEVLNYNDLTEDEL